MSSMGGSRDRLRALLKSDQASITEPFTGLCALCIEDPSGTGTAYAKAIPDSCEAVVPISSLFVAAACHNDGYLRAHFVSAVC